MQISSCPDPCTCASSRAAFTEVEYHLGGDKSPLNDADADEDIDPEGYLDLEELDLDELADADKLDPIFGNDVGSSSIS